MSEHVEADVRPLKREVVEIDDDSTADQPAVKRVAESISNTELLELREKVAEMENVIQDARRYSRQLELQFEGSKKRVEFLENLLEQKPIFLENASQKRKVDELQEKLSETLAEATRKEEDWARKESEMAQEIAALKETVNKLMKKIDDPSKKSESLPHIVDHPAKETDLVCVATDSMPETTVDKVTDSENILMMFNPRDPATVSFDSAFDQLFEKIHNNDYSWREMFKKVVGREKFACGMCSNSDLQAVHILPHFFGKKHGRKARAAGAAVSLAAIDYWKCKLESIPTPIPTASSDAEVVE